MDFTTAHEWPEAVITSTRSTAKLFLGVATLSTWVLYLKLVIAIKNRFQFPSPGVVNATLNVSVPLIWLLSPMVFWVTMSTGLSVYGVTLLPQLLPNTCASSEAFGFSYGWPCLRDQMTAEWHADKLRDDMLIFLVMAYSAMALVVAVMFIVMGSLPYEPLVKKEEVVCSRCRRSETLWSDGEKAGMVEHDSLV